MELTAFQIISFFWCKCLPTSRQSILMYSKSLFLTLKKNKWHGKKKFIDKHTLTWRLKYLLYEYTFANKYIRSITLNLLNIYRKSKINMISQPSTVATSCKLPPTAPCSGIQIWSARRRLNLGGCKRPLIWQMFCVYFRRIFSCLCSPKSQFSNYLLRFSFNWEVQFVILWFEHV